MLFVAGVTGGSGRAWGAGLAPFQVRQTALQVGLQTLESSDRCAGLVEFLGVEGSKLFHGCGAVGLSAEGIQEKSDVVQREAEILQALDPADSDEGIWMVETEATRGSLGGCKQVQLFIEPQCAGGLSDLPGDFSDAK